MSRLTNPRRRIGPGPRPGGARDRLLDAAGKLFYRHGFSAVGIDWILREAGVAKMTLYRHFASKDELIVAYLDRADEQFWTWAETAMAGAPTAEARLAALFGAVGRLAAGPECLGCAFQGAATAFPERPHPGHRRALAHKLAVRDRLVELAREAGLRAPESLAAGLWLLMDGAWAAARTFGTLDSPAAEVKDAAVALLDAHRRRGRARPRAARRRKQELQRFNRSRRGAR